MELFPTLYWKFCNVEMVGRCTSNIVSPLPSSICALILVVISSYSFSSGLTRAVALQYSQLQNAFLKHKYCSPAIYDVDKMTKGWQNLLIDE